MNGNLDESSSQVSILACFTSSEPFFQVVRKLIIINVAGDWLTFQFDESLMGKTTEEVDLLVAAFRGLRWFFTCDGRS